MSGLNGFSENAELYTKSLAHSQTEDLELALDHLGEVDGAMCLDVATGTGHTAFFFAERLGHVFATDVNDKMLAQAQEESDGKTLRVRFLKSDCADLNFDDETFEIVSCRLAAHHFTRPEAFLAESHRVLKPGGKLLLIDNVVPEDEQAASWINEYEKQRDPSHIRCLTQSEWEAGIQRRFKLVSSQLFPRTLAYDPWMERMSIKGVQREELWRHLLNSPQVVRDYLKPSEGQERELTLHRLILVAEKNG